MNARFSSSQGSCEVGVVSKSSKSEDILMAMVSCDCFQGYGESGFRAMLWGIDFFVCCEIVNFIKLWLDTLERLLRLVNNVMCRILNLQFYFRSLSLGVRVGLGLFLFLIWGCRLLVSDTGCNAGGDQEGVLLMHEDVSPWSQWQYSRCDWFLYVCKWDLWGNTPSPHHFCIVQHTLGLMLFFLY